MKKPNDIIKNMPQRLSRRQFLHALLLFAGGCAMPPGANSHNNTINPASVSSTSTPTPLEFDGAIAYQHTAAQMEYIPRHTGTEGWRKCGDYILSQFQAQEWVTEEQMFTYRNTECRNIIAKSSSDTEKPIIVLGAHYDSRRYADQDSDTTKRTQPVPAANDGASGVAVMLELARTLKTRSLDHTIWMVAFDAEDNGGIDGWDWIVGSRYFVSRLQHIPQGMVLFDMIGDADQQIYYERNSDKLMSSAIWQIAREMQYESFIPQYRHTMLDDHIPFIEEGIPAVDLIDFDYPYWHTTADTLDKVSVASLESVGRTAEEWLQRGAPGLPSPEEQTSKLFTPVLCHHGCQTRAVAHVKRQTMMAARRMQQDEG